MSDYSSNRGFVRNIVLLCVLSPLRQIAEHEYSADGGRVKLRGVQTNEAPIRYLLSEACNACGEETRECEIIYLRSSECAEKDIPLSAVGNLIPNSESFDGPSISTEDFFCARTEAFCEDNGLSVNWTPIDYRPGEPADSLAEIAEYLGSGFRVSVDITGGPRDAAVLMTLAAQIVRFNAQENEIGPIVYCNLENRTITNQYASFNLVDLASAISAFTRYGRADDLCDCFRVDAPEGGFAITPETRAACIAMREFANDLALCQVGPIKMRIHNVQATLSAAKGVLEEKEASFRLCRDALLCIDSPAIFDCENAYEALCCLGLRELTELLKLDGEDELERLTANGKGIEELRAKLASLKKNCEIARPELLFFGLIDTIKEKFIPDSGNLAETCMNTMRWCVDRQMLLQALAIYREKLSECLIDIGCLEYDSMKVKELNLGNAVKLQDCCNACEINRNGGIEVKSFGKAPYSDILSISNEAAGNLAKVLAWYPIVTYQRNSLVHLNAKKNDTYRRKRKNAKQVLGIQDIDDGLEISCIRDNLLRAVDCLEELISWMGEHPELP